MGLAEDPGSAVVTLTSRALVNRSNYVSENHADPNKKRKANWSVGLARNVNGSPEPVLCDLTSEAVILKFNSHAGKEVTLDGRISHKSRVWSLNKHSVNVKLDRKVDKVYLDEWVKVYLP